jgi:hypothetical protein
MSASQRTELDTTQQKNAQPPPETKPPEKTTPQKTETELKKPPLEKLHYEPVAEHLLQRNPELFDAPIIASAFYQFWCGCDQPIIALERKTVSDPIVVGMIAKDTSAGTKLLPIVDTHHTSQELFYVYPKPLKLSAKFSQNFEGLAEIVMVASVLNQSRLLSASFGEGSQSQKMVYTDFQNAFECCWFRNDRQLQAEPAEGILKVDVDKALLLHEKFKVVQEKNQIFLGERYKTLIKIIFTPEEWIMTLPTLFSKSPLIQQSTRNDILAARKKFMLLAFKNPMIREILFQNHEILAEDIGKEFSEFFVKNNLLKQFNLQSTQTSQQLVTQFKTQLAKVNTLDNLENFILESKDFSNDDKKECVANFKMDLIKKQRTLKDVMDIIDDLDSNPKYQFVRERSGLTNFDAKGNTFRGKEISNTYSTIIETAKKKMILIALTNRQLGFKLAEQGKNHEKFNSDYNLLLSNSKYAEFINEHRQCAYWGMGAIKGMFGIETTSKKMLHDNEHLDENVELLRAALS